MNLRFIEWIFAVIAAVLLLAFATIVFLRFGFPFFLINFVLLGVAGLIAVAHDADQHSPYWGLLTWGLLGGLVSLNLMELARGLSPVLPLA